MGVAELEHCPHCGEGIDVYAHSCPTCGQSVVDAKIVTLGKLRDSGAVSAAAAFEEMVGLLETPEAAVERSETAPPIRKQITDLTRSDLAAYPIWEFALDEEGTRGQDEATVRPRPDLDVADLEEGLLVVRTGFVARDGTPFDGFATPAEDGQLHSVQPTIVAAAGQVRFWFGLKAPEREDLDVAYATLGKTPDELFPLTFRATIPGPTGPLEGEIPAFVHMLDTELVELR